MKKTLSFLLVLAMVLSSFTFAFAADQVKPNAEVKTHKPYIVGRDDGTFAPKDSITKEEVATMIARAKGLKAATPKFEDADKIGGWAKDYVGALQKAGIVKGNDKKCFEPKKEVTRAELATMLVNAYEGEIEVGENSFKDVPAKAWYAETAKKSAAAGIVKGDEKGNFNANGKASRAETVAMVNRMLGLDKVEGADKLETELKDEKEWPAWAKNDILIASTKFEYKDVDGKLVVVDEDEVKLEEAIKEAEEAIAALPSVDKVKIEDKAAVANAKALVAAVKALDEDAEVEGEEVIAKLEAKIAELEEAAKELKVVDVSAINATQVKVVFSKEVDKDTIVSNEDAGTIAKHDSVDNIKMTSIDGTDGTLTAKVEKDNKTVIVSNTEVFEGRYHVVIDNITEKDGTEKVEKFDKVVDLGKDTVAPKVLGFEQVDTDKVKINFSEPMAALATANITFKDETGKEIKKAATPAEGQVNEAAIEKGKDFLEVNLEKIEAGKKVTVTIKNAKDLAGNLISPQPSEIVIYKEKLAEFKPEISSITQTGAKTFNIKFSEDLDGSLETATAATAIILDQPTAAGTDVVKATKIEKVSASEYKITVGENLKGLVTVTVAKAGVKNELGQVAEDDLTKLVTFKEDTKAPVAIAKLVKNDKNEEVIELTFDKDVTKGDVTITGSYVKDYVTTDLDTVPAAAAIYADGKDGKDSKKVLYVPLAANADADKNLAVKGAKYNLTLNSTDIKAENNVAMKEVKVSFTRQGDGETPVEENKEKATITKKTGIKQLTDNNKVEITFNLTSGYELDGASATNVANYKIDGVVIESAKLLPVETSKTEQKVVLTLKEGSNTFTGDRNIVVENVKVKGSTVAMDKHTDVIANLKENVRPTIKKAEITGAKEITVTFSEEIKSVKGNDFVVKVGEVALNLADTKSVEVDTDDAKKVKITLKSELTEKELAQEITIEPTEEAGNFEVKDLADNELKEFKPVVVVKP